MRWVFTIYRLDIKAKTLTNLISNDKKKSLEQIFKPILECLIAIFMVVIGMSLYSILPQNINSELISSILLYILIFLVGVDLSSIKIQFLTLDHIKVPIFTILALFISAYITTFFLEKSLFLSKKAIFAVKLWS